MRHLYQSLFIYSTLSLSLSYLVAAAHIGGESDSGTVLELIVAAQPLHLPEHLYHLLDACKQLNGLQASSIHPPVREAHP